MDFSRSSTARTTRSSSTVRSRPATRQPRPEEFSKAPPPRKLETQPASTIVVIGDSLADWLAYGLEEIYADQPQLGVERRIRPNSGLIHYEPRNDTLEWSQAIKDILATEKPGAIVVMLGLNDRVPFKVRAEPSRSKAGGQATCGWSQPRREAGRQAAGGASGAAAARTRCQDRGAAGACRGSATVRRTTAAAAAEPQHPAPGGTYEFHTDEWAELYAKRIDDMIAALKSKGVPVLWVGLPAVRGPRATGDMSYLDELYHARGRQGRHHLRRHLGRLRRRERALHRAGAGFRRPDSPAAHGRRRSLHQGPAPRSSRIMSSRN